MIRNDPRESNASLPATLMIVESAQCNMWHEAAIQGKEDNEPVLNTSWAFDFVTESQRIEVWVEVPETLDMYEARLYLMANPEAGVGEEINSIPLAWEPGLYGQLDPQSYGGYNLESKGFRGVAYASCESYGQDMLINYTSPVNGKCLYHLVFIGEKGTGKLQFAVKTRFEESSLTLLEPVGRVYANPSANATRLVFASNNVTLKEAKLYYTINNWQSVSEENMVINEQNATCSGTIPSQEAGTLVQYRVEAIDMLGEEVVAAGNYTVKYEASIDFALSREAVFISEPVIVSGSLTPPVENLKTSIYFSSPTGTVEKTAFTGPDGSWTVTFVTDETGNWTFQA